MSKKIVLSATLATITGVFVAPAMVLHEWVGPWAMVWAASAAAELGVGVATICIRTLRNVRMQVIVRAGSVWSVVAAAVVVSESLTWSGFGRMLAAVGIAYAAMLTILVPLAVCQSKPWVSKVFSTVVESHAILSHQYPDRY
jgi:hypothetical protein